MPDLSQFETIRYEVRKDRVATVTLSRPEALNSFNRRMEEEFKALWTRVREDDAVHVVVLRAEGERAFSPGADVREGYDRLAVSNTWNVVDPGENLGPKFNKVWKPVISAVHGICAGGAFYWLNESDIIICSEDAEFFDPHVTYGITAALEPIGLRYKMPLGEVLRMVLMGNDERMTAETALRVGLVSEVVARDCLWERANELARKIAEKPPIAIQGSVRAIWEALDVGRSAALARGIYYPQIANYKGSEGVDRNAIMSKAKKFERR